MTTCTFNFQSPKSLERIEIIRAALLRGPKSKADLAKILGVSDATVHDFTKHLHKEKRTHIHAWRRCINHHAALWVWGTGVDAKQPAWIKAPPPPRAPSVREMKPVEVPGSWIDLPSRTAPIIRSLKAPPVARHPFDVMFFGPAYVGLSAELREMTA